MEGKNVLAVVLAALMGVLATTTWTRPARTKSDADTAGPPGTSAASAKPPAPRKGAAPASTAPPPEASEAWNPVSQMESAFPSAFPSPPSGRPKANALDAPVHVVLASLPNPTVPAFASDFDRGAGAIERAAQSQRYVVQRYHYPWDTEPGAPGWILFRRDGRTSVELLLVLVVSERPASGFDKAELAAALEIFETIAGWSDAGPHNELALLGPYYSGSAISLEQHLRAWCAEKQGRCAARDLFAVSGSATRRETKAIVERLGDSFATSTFRATVLPDDLLLLGMRRFLEERLSVSADEMADLTESSTDYGNAVASDTTSATTADGGIASNTPSSADAGVAASRAVPAGARAGDCPRAGASTITDDAHSAKGLTIPIPLRLGALTGNVDSSDQPRTFDSGGADKISLELNSTFETLSRHGIRHVGILATTTEDKLFLARQFREFAPNLRLHTYEGSIDLANRERDKGTLDGVMVASSYPLFPATQLWNDATKGALVQFPSMTAEGIYNALLALLARSDGALEQALPLRLRDYVSPFCTGTAVVGPSAWISVSIAGQLWPLAVYPPSPFKNTHERLCACPESDPYLFQPKARSLAGVPRPQAGVNFLTVVGAVVVLLLLLMTCVGFIPFKRSSYLRGLLVSFDPTATATATASGPAFPSQGPERRIATIGVMALATTALVMGKVLSLPQYFADDTLFPLYSKVIGSLLQLGAVLLAVLTWVIVLRQQLDAATHDQTVAARRVQVALGVFSAALCVAWYLLPLEAQTRQPDGHTFFFYVRATDPSVGLTPTIPLFMAGMAIYSASLLLLSISRRSARLKALARDWEHPPDEVPAHSFYTCANAMTQFGANASYPLLLPCFVGTVVGTLVLCFSPLRLGSLEGRGFDLGCSICFSLLFSLTLATAWRAHALWTRLRDFTHALANHPAAKALPRLPLSVALRFRSPAPGQVGDRRIEVSVKMKEHALGLDRPPTVAELRSDLDSYWFPLRHGTTPHEAGGAAPAPQPEAAALLKEDILALEMADVLGIMCDATRTMLFIATGTGLVALLGSALYPFQPAAALTGAGLASMGLVILVALRLLLGLERDDVLSRVAGTSPGAVTPSLGLAARFVGYVIVPLGGLIASRLPNTASVLDLLKGLANTLNR